MKNVRELTDADIGKFIMSYDPNIMRITDIEDVVLSILNKRELKQNGLFMKKITICDDANIYIYEFLDLLTNKSTYNEIKLFKNTPINTVYYVVLDEKEHNIILEI